MFRSVRGDSRGSAGETLREEEAEMLGMSSDPSSNSSTGVSTDDGGVYRGVKAMLRANRLRLRGFFEVVGF